jgi:hypothetical protein
MMPGSDAYRGSFRRRSVGHHRRELDLDVLEAAVDLAGHHRGLLVVGELDRRGVGGLTPTEHLGDHLADDVGVVVDRLLAHEDDLGLLGVDELLEGARDHRRLDGVLADHQDGAVRAHGEAGPELLLGDLPPDAGENDLGAALLFLDSQRLFDGDLAEGIDDVFDVVADDSGAVWTHLDRGVRVRDPLRRYQNFHEKPPRREWKS